MTPTAAINIVLDDIIDALLLAEQKQNACTEEGDIFEAARYSAHIESLESLKAQIVHRGAELSELSDGKINSLSFPFNINSTVYVRLNDHGRECLRKNHARFATAYRGKRAYPFRPPEEDEDGWSRWQMWQLMEELGPHISIGMNPPFDPKIRIEVKA